MKKTVSLLVIIMIMVVLGACGVKVQKLKLQQWKNFTSRIS